MERWRERTFEPRCTGLEACVNIKYYFTGWIKLLEVLEFFRTEGGEEEY